MTKYNNKITKAEVGTNPLGVPWPSDPQGAFLALRRGGLEAAKRVNADPARLEHLKHVLRLILLHAEARFDAEVAHRTRQKQNAASAALRVRERRIAAAEKQAEAYHSAARRVLKEAGVRVQVPLGNTIEGDMNKSVSNKETSNAG